MAPPHELSRARALRLGAPSRPRQLLPLDLLDSVDDPLPRAQAVHVARGQWFVGPLARSDNGALAVPQDLQIGSAQNVDVADVIPSPLFVAGFYRLFTQ